MNDEQLERTACLVAELALSDPTGEDLVTLVLAGIAETRRLREASNNAQRARWREQYRQQRQKRAMSSSAGQTSP